MKSTQQPLIVITGPTASGKSALALSLAERYNGEIICADSRTVYVGMDIGTAKPNAQDRQKVTHHLLDIVKPNELFTLADFQQLARAAIDDIRRRGKVPFLVGGSGLYIDSIVLDYKLKISPRQQHSFLENLDVSELQMMLKYLHISLPTNYKNKRHLIRTLEQKEVNNSRREVPIPDTYVVAISTDKAILQKKIHDRIDDIFASDVKNEALILSEQYGWDAESMTGNIYPILRRLVTGEINESTAKALAVTRDSQLVKKQLTWLRRHKFIKWQTISEADAYISDLLGTSIRESVLR